LDGQFPRLYVNMVRAGEATGALDMALERLAEFRGKARELRESIFSALLYPSILVVMAVVAVAVMLAFVVPRFTEMFVDAGRELPLLTRVVVASGNFVEQWWWAIGLAVAGVFLWLRRAWRDPVRREAWDARLLRLPLAGPLVTKIEAGRFTRTLGTLLGNGVSLLTAMDIAKQVVGNRVIARGLSEVALKVRQGEGLARPLAEADVLPPLTNQLLRVGEETGRLEHMLQQLADIYEREVRDGIARLLTLAEPVIILVIAGFITVIILSVVLAVIETNNLAF
jgi:general secretion pathway protein F